MTPSDHNNNKTDRYQFCEKEKKNSYQKNSNEMKCSGLWKEIQFEYELKKA